MAYKLRCTLSGHSMDVRCVAVTNESNQRIITGSRDRTAKIWSAVDEPQGFVEELTLQGHTNFVCCACVLSPDDNHPSGLILTGSNDKTICAFNFLSPEPLYRLTGHNNTVCALAAGKFGTILSGSWDCTAKVWLGQKCMLTLQGHEATVWCVAIITQQGVMLTGSADKTIKLWKAGHCERTFTGHKDCVRDIAIVSDVQFLSASNDGTIRKWLTSGECIALFEGHESYIYSLALLPNSTDFVSAGEDRTVRVWKNERCTQIIRLPTQSVWAIATLQNGDIVTGTGDGMIRIFSAAAERHAEPEILKAYEKEIASSTLTSNEVGDIKINELPGKEALYEPGQRNGQTKLIREGSKVTVYEWSVEESTWLKIGDMIGSAGAQNAGGKIHFEGKEYDHVFDVTITDGRPPLKLPYNVTEDPWFAAQRFIERNDLDQMFLDQVANFIIKNTQGITLNTEVPNSGSDPLTGQSRYIPSSSAHSATTPGIDPFTGAGRYVPTYQQTSDSSIATNKHSSYFPQKSLRCFDTANLEAIHNKLQELNSQLGAEALKVEDQVIVNIVKLADSGTSGVLQPLKTLEELLMNWPKESVFPVLDVLRLAIRHVGVNDYFCKSNSGNSFVDFLLNLLSRDNSTANQMLSLRILSNMMCQPSGKTLVLQRRSDIIANVLKVLPSENKNVLIACATVFLNYSVLFGNIRDFEAKLECLSAIAQILVEINDNEAEFRLLVAIGTLITEDSDCIDIIRSLNILPFINKLKEVGDPIKLSECATDIVRKVA